jgi:hypothetical protein
MTMKYAKTHHPTYLFHHHQLKALWTEEPDRFSYLSWNDQLDLHTYYLLTLDKTELELIAHGAACNSAIRHSPSEPAEPMPG